MSKDPDPSAFYESTSRLGSRWDQEGAEFVRSNLEWTSRFAQRLVSINPGVTAEQALELANELSLEDNLRALAPERVAEDLLRI